MLVFIVIIVCEGDIDMIVYIVKVFERKFFVIIMKGLGIVVDVVVDYLEKYFMFIVILLLNMN